MTRVRPLRAIVGWERGASLANVDPTHDARRALGGYTWCPSFDEAADDMFAPWRVLRAKVTGSDFYALEAKHGIAEPSPHGPDAAGILMEVIL